MSDFLLTWEPEVGADLVVEGNDLARTDGLETAVLLSLFLDERAQPDDRLPPGADRRGWWGGEIGSRLWLLTERGKMLPSLARQVETTTAAALRWFVDDGVAGRVEATAAATNGRVDVAVRIQKPAELSSQRFAYAWEAQGGGS